jgi:hypothetical protein
LNQGFFDPWFVYPMSRIFFSTRWNANGPNIPLFPLGRRRCPTGRRPIVSESELSSLNPTVLAKGDVCHLYDVDEKTVIQDCITRRSAAG